MKYRIVESSDRGTSQLGLVLLCLFSSCRNETEEISSEIESCVSRCQQEDAATKLHEADWSQIPQNVGQYISAQIRTSDVLSPDKGPPAVTGLATH